jgi:chorismate dehydratase
VPTANWSPPEVPPVDSLRLGCVRYLNALPLIHGWPAAVRFDHPSTLCQQLAAGQLDVALVSSFEYLRNPVYSVVDHVAIASQGPVYSVILAHINTVEELQEIVVDPASATSVNLLRCLLGERAIPARFVSAGDLSSTRGRLLIGDQAIRFREEAAEKVQFFDLGAAWTETVGLPFVYALWLIRPDFAGEKELANALRSLAIENLEKLSELIANQPQPRQAFCEFYFRQCLRFTFDEEEKRGFQKFAELCLKHGLLTSFPTAPRLV